MRQHRVNIRLINKVVSARVNDYCVFALRIYLYYGVPVFYIGCFYKRYVKNFGKKAAVRSYNCGMINRRPRTRCGNRLVKPFSAGENIHLHALLGFAVGNDVLKLIHIINIAGPEI